VRNINLHHLEHSSQNWQKTVGTEKKVDIISQLEKGEQNVDICHNVRTTHSNVCAIHDNAHRITECGKSGTKVSV
jgi:transcriptional regulator